jgi:hypothetical protein
MTAKKAKKKTTKKPKRRKQAAAALPFEATPIPDEFQTTASDFSLHQLFQQQTMDMLDRSDLDEEQKQSILVAMNCPCCGGSGMSFTMKLKRKK